MNDVIGQFLQSEKPPKKITFSIGINSKKYLQVIVQWLAVRMHEYDLFTVVFNEDYDEENPDVGSYFRLHVESEYISSITTLAEYIDSLESRAFNEGIRNLIKTKL